MDLLFACVALGFWWMSRHATLDGDRILYWICACGAALIAGLDWLVSA